MFKCKKRKKSFENETNMLKVSINIWVLLYSWKYKKLSSFQELGEFTAKITELCRCIPVYGLADVKEVLQLISTTKAITVAEARPLKVLNYLQVECHFYKGLFI